MCDLWLMSGKGMQSLLQQSEAWMTNRWFRHRLLLLPGSRDENHTWAKNNAIFDQKWLTIDMKLERNMALLP